MPLPRKAQIELATTALQNSMDHFVEQQMSKESETRLSQTLVNTKAFYEQEARAPSPLPYQEAFVAAWEKAQCYLRQLVKARLEAGRVGQHTIDRPPLETVPQTMPPQPSEPVLIADEGEEIETGETETAETDEMPPLMKWGLLGFVGYLGWRVLKGK